MNDLGRELNLPEYPRSAAYEPRWVLDNLMGPNVLWLAEALGGAMAFRPGMRVLDLGCGKAISSIFLAREHGVQVWAADLWIKPTENRVRVDAAGLGDRVFPIHVEAHALPFAEGFFDAIVSADAYHYFGTSDLYLGYCARFLKSGGQIGIVVPGIRTELSDGLPDHLEPFWEPEFWSFHSPAWWRSLWERTGPVTVEVADMLPRGWEHWLLWLEVAERYGYPTSAREAEMLRVDAGRNFGFTRVVAHRHAE